MTTARTTHPAKDSALPPELESLPVEDPQKTSTMLSTEAILEGIQKATSRHSAGSATGPDTEFSGTESLDYGMKLPIEKRRIWVALRLEHFRLMIVSYAETVIREVDDKKSVSYAEAVAVTETDGMTRSVPLEKDILRWMLDE